MSRRNAVNKTNYVQRGRLTPDEMASARKQQAEVSAGAKGKTRVSVKAPKARGGPAASRRRSGRGASR